MTAAEVAGVCVWSARSDHRAVAGTGPGGSRVGHVQLGLTGWRIVLTARGGPAQGPGPAIDPPIRRIPRGVGGTVYEKGTLVSRVFGYVCLSDAGVPATVERWRTRVAAHCQAEDLALELVFVDNGVPDVAAVRAGWTALLDVLGLDRDPGEGQLLVVVPGLTHLSEDLTVLARMRAQLEHAGARVVLMPRIPPHRKRREGTTNRPA